MAGEQVASALCRASSEATTELYAV